MNSELNVINSVHESEWPTDINAMRLTHCFR